MLDIERTADLLAAIYGPDAAPAVLRGVEETCRKYESRIPRRERAILTERDALLIAYPDQVQTPGVSALACLREFAASYLESLVSGIHLLPFFPSSSDDGFSVTDYRAVDPRYGSWQDIEKLGRQYSLMFDAVINHVSAESQWFQAFLRGEPRYSDYFIRITGSADLSTVVRPRSQPLLTPLDSLHGNEAVWTTFGPDQIDLDYRNPDVVLDILDLLLYYVGQGASFLRLDAVAYLWKELNTECIHLPQAHLIVQLMRAVMDDLAPHVALLTETNVPQAENATYFGDGTNEAHLAYNFPLPPLVLHAFQTATATVLADWARSLRWPSEDCTYFNILASHDGIGLNPVKGILTEGEIEELTRTVDDGGGRISLKTNPDGTSSPYEINANYFDALDRPGETIDMHLKVQRFITAHAILLAFKGLPGLYFHSLFGSRGWPEGVAQTGRKRSINREKLDRDKLTAELLDGRSLRAQVYRGMGLLLRARRGVPAFSPQAAQRVLAGDGRLFALLRGDEDSSAQVLCIHNVSPETQSFRCDQWKAPEARAAPVHDVITAERIDWLPQGSITLKPFQSMWLTI